MAGIKNFLVHTYRRKFVRNVAVVASGTAGAMIISIAFSPVITRLYGPEAFGLLGVFMALLAVLAPISALTYPVAIVLPKEDSDAKGIARLSAYIAMAMTLLVTIVILVAGNRFLSLIDAEAISSFALLLPLAMLFVVLMDIAKQWLIRKKQFRITARAEVLQALLINSSKAGAGWFYPLASVLIVLSTLGNAIHAGMLAFGINRSKATINTDSQKEKTAKSLWELAKKHYDFPLYRAPQVFINAVSQNLPVVMLAAFFGPASAGFYAICRRVLGMPSRLIGTSVGSVFYPRITEASHKGEDLTKLIFKTTLGLGAIGFAPFALVVAFGPWLFGFVFGSEWVVAGEYARWLALWLFFGFINRPSVASIPVLGLQGVFLIYEIASVLLRTGALIVGFYLLKNDVLAIMLFSLAGVILNTSLIVITIFNSQHNRENKSLF
ncbi:MAG: oligosaccharide flippase family protein [Candidatus Aminicenantes bacterium]